MRSRQDLVKFIRYVLSEGPSEYWGIGGAGMVLVCPEDHTVFLQKRSAHVTGGAGQWAFPGGGIHAEGDYERHWKVPIPEHVMLSDNSPRFYQGALKEVEEECGSVPQHKIVNFYLYEDRGFKYKTFVASMTLQEKQKWSPRAEESSRWEVGEMKWFNVDEFLGLDLFFGFTPELVQKVVNAAS